MRLLIHLTFLSLFISVSGLWAQDGQLDSTFADNGFFESFTPLSFKKLLPLKNGHTLVVGEHEVNNYRFGVGILDIDPQGINVSYKGHDYGVGVNPNKQLLDATITPDDKVVGVGWEDLNAGICHLFMFNEDGTLDSTINNEGFIAFPFATQGRKINAQQDGRFLILGSKNRDQVIVRLLPNFQVDSTFGANGIVDITESFSYHNDIARQADGKILFLHPGFKELQIKRFHDNGQVDIQFGTSGLFAMNFARKIENASFVVQNSGKIVAMVQSDSATYLVRINPNGAVDSTFGTNGIVTIQIPGTETIGADLTLQVDGKILIGGNIGDSSKFYSHFWVHRLLSNGIPDYTFGDSAHAITLTPYHKFTSVNKIALQKDGNILLGATSDLNFPGQFADDWFVMTRYISGVNLGLLDFNSSSSITQIYPNPIQHTATLTFSLSQSEQLSLELHDLQGRKIQTFFEAQSFKQGDNEIELSFEEVTVSGYYMLSLRNGKMVMRVKVLKQ